MGIYSWFKSLAGRRASQPGMVRFHDFVTRRTVSIPASELRPGCIQVRIQGSNDVVWALPEQLQRGEIRHPRFSDDIRAYIQDIQSAFAEHRDLTVEQWEDGFRRDANPTREIAIWSYAADVYRLFTAAEASAQRRSDVYKILVACLTTSPNSVWHVVPPTALSQTEVEKIVSRFYGGNKESARPKA